MVGKILKSLTSGLNNVVVAIEESNDLSTISKEELQSSLEVHEQRMKEGNADKVKSEITLQVKFI